MNFLMVLFMRHNPYFNRWFSAILISDGVENTGEESQSLF